MKNAVRAGRGYDVAGYALATTALATAVLYWLGFPLLAAPALLLSCPVVLLYAWWLSRQALKPLNHVGRTDIRRIR